MVAADRLIVRLKEYADENLAQSMQNNSEDPGDRYLGVSVDTLAEVAADHGELSLDQVAILLNSRYYEARHLALLIISLKVYEERPDALAATDFLKDQILEGDALNHTFLIEVAAHLLGHPLFANAEKFVQKLAQSSDRMHWRLAIRACDAWLARKSYEFPLEILALTCTHNGRDISQPQGWLFREIAGADVGAARKFVAKHARRFSTDFQHQVPPIDMEHII